MTFMYVVSHLVRAHVSYARDDAQTGTICTVWKTTLSIFAGKGIRVARCSVICTHFLPQRKSLLRCPLRF